MKSSRTDPSGSGGRNIREPLRRDRIESTALALIEEVGLEGFSTRRLGQMLGCEAMSIYHHYPDKAQLMSALVDRVVSSVAVPTREHAPTERLRQLAAGWRAMALRHPRFFPVLAVHDRTPRRAWPTSTRSSLRFVMPACRKKAPRGCFVS